MNTRQKYANTAMAEILASLLRGMEAQGHYLEDGHWYGMDEETIAQSAFQLADTMIAYDEGTAVREAEDDPR